MNKRALLLGLAVIAGVAVFVVSKGIYVGHRVENWSAVVPGKDGKTDHPMMICRYFDMGGYHEVPMWPPGTDPNTLLWPDGQKPNVATEGCPNRWPWG